MVGVFGIGGLNYDDAINWSATPGKLSAVAILHLHHFPGNAGSGIVRDNFDEVPMIDPGSHALAHFTNQLRPMLLS